MTYPFNNFYDLIVAQSQRRSKSVALIIDNTKITYGQMRQEIDPLAGFLQEKGIKRGDKVALFLRNSAEFVYSVFALSKIGAIVVPVNTFLKEEELNYILEDSEAVALIASKIHEEVVNKSQADNLCHFVLWESETYEKGLENYTFEEALSCVNVASYEKIALDETAVIIYTSGTTGKPKGAMLSNKNIFSNAISGSMTIKVTDKDVGMVFLPMFHSFTFSIGIMMPMYMGMSIVIVKSLKPFANIFKQTLMKRVTIFLGIPDVYNALVKAKLPWYFMWFNCVRAFISGAAALQPKTIEGMAKKFKRATLLEGYGLSEASPAVCMNTFAKQKIGSVGTALHEYEMNIVDDEMNEVPKGTIGDIIVKGDNVMQGYWKRPEATSETIINGWLLTGDMGYMDEEGFLFIVDRKKDLIISKGINIYPREVEEVIDGFAGISASAVIGFMDEKQGEIPIVYLELDEKVHTIDELALKKYMKEHLANYKIPTS